MTEVNGELVGGQWCLDVWRNELFDVVEKQQVGFVDIRPET